MIHQYPIHDENFGRTGLQELPVAAGSASRQTGRPSHRGVRVAPVLEALGWCAVPPWHWVYQHRGRRTLLGTLGPRFFWGKVQVDDWWTTGGRLVTLTAEVLITLVNRNV